MIPTRDRRTMVLQTIDSLLAQTEPGWEAIVVDDCSTDGTLDSLVALSRDEARVRPFRRSSSRGGAPVCRNEGQARARGAFVIFLDSDNPLMKHALESRLEFLRRHPDHDFAVSLCQLFDHTPGDSSRLFNIPTARSEFDRFLCFDTPWDTHCVTWRRAVLDRLGPWDEELPSWQDWDYHVRALTIELRFGWKTSAPDCYRRSSTSDSIGAVSQQPAHLLSHQALVERTADRLREHGLLSDHRQRLLHGVLFWLSQRWAQEGRLSFAVDLWRENARRFGIPRRIYWSGLTLLHATRLPLAWKVDRRIIRRVWPADMFPWEFPTQNW